MFKFASAKYQIAFLAVAVLVNIVCSDELSELGILEETDVDPENQPPVPCEYHCTLPTTPYSPLCGSDGKTYGNICHLNTFNRCHPTAHILRISGGTCPHQHCVSDRHPITCECVRRFPRPPIVRCFSSSPPHRPVTCSNISRPVCGTDGFTYTNACRLAFDTACFGYHVRVCHNGPCP